MAYLNELDYIKLLVVVNLVWFIFYFRESILLTLSKRFVKVFIKATTGKPVIKIVRLSKDNTFQALGKRFVWDHRNAIGRWGVFDENSSAMLKVEASDKDINSLEFSNVYQNKILEWLMLVKKSTHLLLMLCLLIVNVFITFLVLAKVFGLIK